MLKCCGGMEWLIDHGSVHINKKNIEVLSLRDYRDHDEIGAMKLSYCPNCGKKRD